MRPPSERQSDGDPRRYGQPPHSRLGPVWQKRDETDWRLLGGEGAHRIEEGTILARLAGETMAEVHSFHHRAVKTVGRDRQPIAWSGDGIIGALPQADPFLLSRVSCIRFGRVSRMIVEHFRQHAAKQSDRTRRRA